MDEGKQFETEYPYVVWSKDESVKTPWTKAGEREYTLKKKKAIQKKKNSSTVELIRTFYRVFRRTNQSDGRHFLSSEDGSSKRRESRTIYTAVV